MKRFSLADIKPAGWLQRELRRDLDGFVGNLDAIVPEILVDDDIYGKNRLTKDVKVKDVGSLNEGNDWEVQYLWWGAEQLGNWLDGLIRHAFLLGDEDARRKAEFFLDRAFDAQDEDGYMGIYAPDLRFDFNGENGELWAQTTLFRAALAYDELSGQNRYLPGVLRAVERTMQAYPVWKSEPYRTVEDYSGLTHGLMFTDVMYELYRLTQDARYIEYACFLYEDYCRHPLHDQDIMRHHLLDDEWHWRDHGAHVYEHVRALITASLSKRGDYAELVRTYFAKLPFCLQPSGGPIGDECISQRVADPEKTGYEYCSIQELSYSYEMMLETTGDFCWADRIERLVLNAGFAARHPFRSQISYLNCDNSYKMMGDGMSRAGVGENARYKYSVAHKDAAVCCVPNAGKTLPYFLHHMYLPQEDGIAIALYGPSVLSTNWHGTPVQIEQKTAYPFENAVTIRVTAGTELKLCLRVPAWTKNVTVSGTAFSRTARGIEILCEGNAEFTLVFEECVQAHLDWMGNDYFTAGALVYSLPIEAREHFGITYQGVYRDTRYEAMNEKFRDLASLATSAQTAVRTMRGRDFQDPPAYTIVLRNRVSGKDETVELLPIGSTILRRTTFVHGDERID